MSEFKEVWYLSKQGKVDRNAIKILTCGNKIISCNDFGSKQSFSRYKMLSSWGDKSYTLGQKRRRVECKECEGHGEIACVVICRECNGTGKVWEYSE